MTLRRDCPRESGSSAVSQSLTKRGLALRSSPDHGAKSVVAWITTGGHAEGGDEACLERRALGRGVHRAASGADQVAQCFDDRCRRCGGAPLFEAGQVVDRDAGESRQLLASQAGRPTPAAGRHAYRGGVDTVAPAPQGASERPRFHSSSVQASAALVLALAVLRQPDGYLTLSFPPRMGE